MREVRCECNEWIELGMMNCVEELEHKENRRVESIRVLRWCGHIKRMIEYRTARRAEISGGRVRSRPRIG